MKKYFYSFLALSLLFLTGCGSKTLKCSRDNSYSDDMKMYQNLNVTFNGDSVSKLSMDMDIQLSEDYLEFKDSLIESIESEFSTFVNEKGLSYSTSVRDDGFVFKLKVNFNRLSAEAKNELDIIDSENSYDSIKNELEETGYTCK